MDVLKKLSRELQVVLGGGVILLIISFFDWQQVSAFGYSAGITEWHGIGILAALLVIAMLVWEAARLFAVKIPLGTLSEALVSVGLAVLMAVFTVITFLTHNEARHWPAWIGLIVAIVVAGAALVRAREEGAQLPATHAGPTGGAQP
jgi:hypothetical protein